MGTNQLICSANQLTAFNMMITLVFNWLSLDVKVLDLVVLGQKSIAKFQKINRNVYARRKPNVPKVLQRAITTKNKYNASLLK